MDLSLTPTRGSPSTPLLEQIERWLAKPWVPRLINVVMLLVLTACLAQWTWRLWQPGVDPGPGAAAPVPDTSAEYNVTTLISANLFGQAAAVPAKMALENIPLSSLNLVLTGVMVTPAGSFALISADGGPETPIGIGEEITGGASLQEVYADRVLIKRGGATESLMLKDIGPALPSGAITAAPRPAPATQKPATPEVRQLGTNSFAVEREQINRQMQRPEFLSQALMVPNAGGGFLVREIQPGSLYEKLGLKVGDVIYSVNGQAVNTVDDVMKIYQQLSGAGNAGQVNLDVRRAGKNESLQYNLQ